MKTPILLSKRLRLRPMGWAAEQDYSHWLNDPEVVKFSEQRHKRHTPKSCRTYIESFNHETDHIWAIHLGDKHIGNITAHRDVHNGLANLGILIGAKDEWGKGFGTEAWGAVIEWAGKIGVRRVEAGCMEANVGMMVVCLENGMKAHETIPDHFLLNGAPVSLVIFGKNL